MRTPTDTFCQTPARDSDLVLGLPGETMPGKRFVEVEASHRHRPSTIPSLVKNTFALRNDAGGIDGGWT